MAYKTKGQTQCVFKCLNGKCQVATLHMSLILLILKYVLHKIVFHFIFLKIFTNTYY